MKIPKFVSYLKEPDSLEACFNEHKNDKGICYGLYGGDKFSDNLSYSCIDCPYHTPFVSDCENIDGYVSKDNLYRMLSRFRMKHLLSEREQNILLEISKEIKNMPNEK